MRYILLLLILISTQSNAQLVETKSFSITLPDELTVQTDKVSRILAFDKERNPFVNIEFGNGVYEQYSEIVSRVNETLVTMGSVLSPKECGDGCESMYAQAKVEKEHLTFYFYFYVVKSTKHSFIISIASQSAINSGDIEITGIAKQILQSGK
jgi:hypothetical protein